MFTHFKIECSEHHIVIFFFNIYYVTFLLQPSCSRATSRYVRGQTRATRGRGRRRRSDIEPHARVYVFLWGHNLGSKGGQTHNSKLDKQASFGTWAFFFTHKSGLITGWILNCACGGKTECSSLSEHNI